MDTPNRMTPNNPAEILLTLDRELDHQVKLVLYGRAAICLGFDNPSPTYRPQWMSMPSSPFLNYPN